MTFSIACFCRCAAVFTVLPFLFFPIGTHAQVLPRKGGLGVKYFPNTPDSLIARLGYVGGAIVQEPVPGATAASLGIQPFDIIMAIDGKTIDLPSDLADIAKTLREKDSIRIVVQRNRTALTLSGVVIPRPKETSATADVIYGAFEYGNGLVRTIYKAPKGKKPKGTVYFLQGLPCYSMDNFQELDKTKQAIDAMVEQGFGVYRMEKGDMGDNLGQTPCAGMGYDEELAMYEAGYKHLLTLKNVDTSRIFLFGHSMGGTTAPLLAAKFQPRGVVVYGTLFKPWIEYLCDAFLYQSQQYGEDLGALRVALERYKPHLYAFFYGAKTITDIIKDPIGREAMQNVMGYDPVSGLAASGRHPKVFRELNNQPVTQAWGAFQNDVLAIYGECDIAAIHPDDHQALINYVNRRRPGQGAFWLAPGTTHTFEEIGTMEEFIRRQSDPMAFYQYAAKRFNPKVFEYACGWMEDKLKTKR